MLRDLFEWEASIEPERPRVLTVAEWRSKGGPDYRSIYAWRIEKLREIRASPINEATGNPVLLDGMMAYYSQPAHWSEFIMDWLDTFDPRRKSIKWMPFVLFQRQNEFLQFLNECYLDEENGLIEKCRDFGLTWLCVAWSVCAWLFVPSVAVGWGSRKQELVDSKGDLSSIFEKIRVLIRRLPPEFLPSRFDERFHSNRMRLINPNSGATIIGEIGEGIGRGGRSSIVFKDESAHYENPEVIESSLGDNTNVQIDISSVNGIGNVFYNKRHSAESEEWYPGKHIEHGKTRIFVADWRDHPNKTQEWYDTRKRRWIADGLQAQFAQEVDRDYAASVEGVIIPLEWIVAATDAHVKLSHWRDKNGKLIDWIMGGWGAGFDVADSVDGDKNGLAVRKGIILTRGEDWGDRDVGVSTRRVITDLQEYRSNREALLCQYDSVGMGSGVKAEFNRLVYTDKIIKPDTVVMVPWNAGGQVIDPNYTLIPDDDESPMNGDTFGNMKAQAWWSIKMRFFRTFQAVTQNIRHNPDELISLDGNIPAIRQIQQELAQPIMVKDSRLRQIVDKKPKGSRSPNIADAIVMAYFPLDPNAGALVVGRYGTTS
jgi:phage terminase large subunit